MDRDQDQDKRAAAGDTGTKYQRALIQTGGVGVFEGDREAGGGLDEDDDKCGSCEGTGRRADYYIRLPPPKKKPIRVPATQPNDA